MTDVIDRLPMIAIELLDAFGIPIGGISELDLRCDVTGSRLIIKRLVPDTPSKATFTPIFERYEVRRRV